MIDEHQLEAFAAAFTALGALHRQPADEETLDAVRSMVREWPLAPVGPTAAGITDLRASAASGETARDVRRDHDRLYGDSAAAIVAPYESVHRGVEGLVFDEQTLEVRAAYRELGLRAPKLNREPDDHVGLEFEFLSRTCLEVLDARDAGEDERAERAEDLGRRFFVEHIATWVPDLLERVAAEARTAFMRGVAELSRGAVEQYSASIGA